VSVDDVGHRVIDVVSAQMKVPIDEMMSSKHGRGLQARRVAYRAMRDQDLTWNDIGRIFGRDHSTVVDSAKKALPEERELAEQITKSLRGDSFFLRLTTNRSGDVEVAVVDPLGGQRVVLEAALAEELLRAAFRTEIRVVGLQ